MSMTDDKPQKKIPVVEIFGPTIQGEGAMCGVRTTFIRFGLCDYRCTMCDSLHAVLPELVRANATWMTQYEIAERLFKQHGCDSNEGKYELNSHWVTLSGGNPCMHNLEELIKRIRGVDIIYGNIKIAVETQGTLWADWIPMCDNVTVSPKSPGMGEEFEPDKFMNFVMRLKHHKGFNVKVVVFSQQDLEFAAHINSIMVDEGLGDAMYLSLGNWMPPGKDTDISNEQIKLDLLKAYDQLSEDLLAMPNMANVKFLPQLHVLAWANRQGV